MQVQKAKKKFSPGKLTHLEKLRDNGIKFCSDNGVALMISLISDEIIKIKYSSDGEFKPDFSYAVEVSEPIHTSFTIEEGEDRVRIVTNKIIIEVFRENLKISFFEKTGLLISEDKEGFLFTHLDEDHTREISVSKTAQQEELFFGLGDKVFDQNLRGKSFINYNYDCFKYTINADPLYRTIPFYIGLHHGISYGIFFDNTWKSYFDFDSKYNATVNFGSEGGEMNYYFIYGPEVLDVIKAYTKMTGLPDLPPKWALGYHQCKWSYFPEGKVAEVAEKFRKLKIPCDAIYLDIDYMEGYRCFTWSKSRFPEHRKMLKKLKESGFKVVVIIDPGIKIDEQYPVYTSGIEQGIFCKMPDGRLYQGPVWPGECNFPDFTNPKARLWWAEQFKGLIEEDGIAGVWNDMNEPAIFDAPGKTFPHDVLHNYDGHPTSHREGHNVYGMQMARATNEGIKKHTKNRPLVITRAGYSGVQKYSAVWTGDNTASWEHLYLANIQCQRLSISGISHVGSDIGGFFGIPDGELFLRWLSLAIFHPLCRTHSIGHNLNGQSATDPNF